MIFEKKEEEEKSDRDFKMDAKNVNKKTIKRDLERIMRREGKLRRKFDERKLIRSAVLLCWLGD